MRILLYSDYPALFEALQQESKRYSGITLLQASPDTELLTLPDFQFIVLAPLAGTTEAGATPSSATQLDTWQEKITTLVELCSLRQARLIFISSDLVFTPSQQAVNELDSPENTSPLATSLLRLEKIIAKLPQSITLRLPPSLSAAPEGGLAQLVARCQAKEPPEQLNYRGLQPLDDLARILLSIILQVDAGAKATGIYHYAGSEPVSQSDLFITLERLLKINIGSAQGISLTNNLTISTKHLLETFGIHPRAWREKLPELLEQLK
ncbi:MAG: sugar nucleotide-binding protein [Pseudomonadaceae bacterium]|nr:sugar nucleotide-binding protein [Pseudomonadaceae bacterium]